MSAFNVTNLKQESVKVIGAGFGRTGTLSLKKSLEILGYKCHHMEEIINKQQYHVFYKLLATPKKERIKKRLLTNLLCNSYGYTATVDFPCAIFYDEILNENPSAKVILTVRDNAATWYKSSINTIFKAYKLLDCWAIKLFANYFICRNKYERIGAKLVLDEIWLKFFEGEFENEQKTIGKYDDWIINVKKNVPSNQLLIFNVKEGWKPLCNFLGQKIPNCDYPHSNEYNSFQKKYIGYIEMVNTTANIIVTGLIGIVCYFVYSKFSSLPICITF